MIARTSIPLQLISLDPDSFHLMVEGRIGEEVFNFIIDTGASRSSFDDKIFADHARIIDTGSNTLRTAGLMSETVEARLGILRNICFGELHIDEMDVVLFNLYPFAEMYQKMTGMKIHGLLGSDFLRRFGARIDYRHSRLNLNL